MREQAKQEHKTLALTADVSEAIDERDWHLLGCQVQPGAEPFLTQYASGSSARTWHTLVSDDFLLETGGVSHRAALVSSFVIMALSGVPGVRQREGALSRGWDSSCSAGGFIKWTRERAQHQHGFILQLLKIAPTASCMSQGHWSTSLSTHVPRFVASLRLVSFVVQYFAVDLHSSTTSPRVDAQASPTRTLCWIAMAFLAHKNRRLAWRSVVRNGHGSVRRATAQRSSSHFRSSYFPAHGNTHTPTHTCVCSTAQHQQHTACVCTQLTRGFKIVCVAFPLRPSFGRSPPPGLAG